MYNNLHYIDQSTHTCITYMYILYLVPYKQTKYYIFTIYLQFIKYNLQQLLFTKFTMCMYVPLLYFFDMKLRLENSENTDMVHVHTPLLLLPCTCIHLH